MAVLFIQTSALFLIRKDDYAFFLKPVDIEKVPGYLDAITQPMDFGTMTEKVAKSKYRSLDEFAVRIRFQRLFISLALPSAKEALNFFFFGSQEDFRLVIFNAKTFNPPRDDIPHRSGENRNVGIGPHIQSVILRHRI